MDDNWLVGAWVLAERKFKATQLLVGGGMEDEACLLAIEALRLGAGSPVCLVHNRKASKQPLSS